MFGSEMRADGTSSVSEEAVIECLVSWRELMSLVRFRGRELAGLVHFHEGRLTASVQFPEWELMSLAQVPMDGADAACSVPGWELLLGYGSGEG